MWMPVPRTQRTVRADSVVLQSGRACGGRHPAKECKGTRALTATRFQQMQPAAAGERMRVPHLRCPLRRPHQAVQRPFFRFPRKPRQLRGMRIIRKGKPPSPKQPPKKKTRQAEQVPEPAVAPKAAPAKLEIPAVVPLNVHDRRWGTSLQPSRESCELAG